MRSLKSLCLHELTILGKWLEPKCHFNKIIPKTLVPLRQDFEFEGFYGEIYIHVNFVDDSKLIDHVNLIQHIFAAMQSVDKHVNDNFLPIHVVTNFTSDYYFWFCKVFNLFQCDPRGFCRYLSTKIRALSACIYFLRLRKNYNQRRLMRPMTN